MFTKKIKPSSKPLAIFKGVFATNEIKKPDPEEQVLGSGCLAHDPGAFNPLLVHVNVNVNVNENASKGPG